MVILSLFDGISMARQAILNAGLTVDKYFSSEIEEKAINVSKFNFPDIINIGNVKNIHYQNGKLFDKINKKVYFEGKIDLLIGGSPCTDFSIAGKMRGMKTLNNIDVVSLEQYLELKNIGVEFIGQSYLFWEYVRLLKEINPKYFFLENVDMKDKWKNLISENIGFSPIKVNSSLFTCQNRVRLYWTNIKYNESLLPKDSNITFKNIFQKNSNPKYYYSAKAINWLVNHSKRMSVNKKIKKLKIYNPSDVINAITASHSKKYSGQRFFAILDSGYKHIEQRDEILKYVKVLEVEKSDISLQILTDYNKVINDVYSYRYITPEECELAQGLPIGYTKCIDDTSRYKAIGNGFTVPVICWFLSFLKREF